MVACNIPWNKIGKLGRFLWSCSSIILLRRYHRVYEFGLYWLLCGFVVAAVLKLLKTKQLHQQIWQKLNKQQEKVTVRKWRRWHHQQIENKNLSSDKSQSWSHEFSLLLNNFFISGELIASCRLNQFCWASIGILSPFQSPSLYWVIYTKSTGAHRRVGVLSTCDIFEAVCGAEHLTVPSSSPR